MRQKKPISLISLYKTSEKMARDLRLESLETRDGRKTFAPEVGQTYSEIPVEWIERLEDMVELKVSTTLNEWANLFITPSFTTLVACKELTGNSRAAYLGITHDVMLWRIIKVIFNFAKETEKKRLHDFSEDEE